MNLSEIIAGDAPELTKIASIAGAFVAGEISAEQGNEMAIAANIHPDRVSNFVVEHQDELEKEAAAQEPTYLEKVAHIVDDVYAGEITEADLEKIASENGISMRDIDAIAGIVYGEELSKEAQLQEVENVLSDESAPYILKTASIAELVGNELMSEDDAYQTATNFGINHDDLAYELEKEAGRKERKKVTARNTNKAVTPKSGGIADKVKGAGEGVAEKAKGVGASIKGAGSKAGTWIGKNKGKAGAIGALGLAATGGGTYYANRD